MHCEFDENVKILIILCCWHSAIFADFTQVKFGQEVQKTEVCRKSLDPHWNTDWFRFEVEDEELQDEPLQIRHVSLDKMVAVFLCFNVNTMCLSLCCTML